MLIDFTDETVLFDFQDRPSKLVLRAGYQRNFTTELALGLPSDANDPACAGGLLPNHQEKAAGLLKLFFEWEITHEELDRARARNNDYLSTFTLECASVRSVYSPGGVSPNDLFQRIVVLTVYVSNDGWGINVTPRGDMTGQFAVAVPLLGYDPSQGVIPCALHPDELIALVEEDVGEWPEPSVLSVYERLKRGISV
jgi:hypothetical protein